MTTKVIIITIIGLIFGAVLGYAYYHYIAVLQELVP